MKGIKTICILFFCFLWSCNSDNESNTGLVVKDRFVRFNLTLDSNENPFVFPNFDPTAQEQATFSLKRLDTFKLPVSLTYANLNTPITVPYSVTFQNIPKTQDISVYTKNDKPSNILYFNKTKVTDTIFIVPKSRFQEDAKVIIQLMKASDPQIRVGYDRATLPMDTFTLNITKFLPIRYNFKQKKISISGNKGEKVTFQITTDQLISEDEIQGLEFISAEFVKFSCNSSSGSGYKFSINRLPIEGLSKTMNFELRLDEKAPQLESTLQLALNNVSNLQFLLGNDDIFAITKPAVISPRSGDIAQHFYNANNPNHRTFGKAWYFNENDKVCKYQSFFAFTTPVKVPIGSEFDNGSGYHRYKIGFVSPTGLGTNPFNFRRFYNNATIQSPAFNLPEAIEFFPENGNNPTQGSIQIVPQNVVFMVDDKRITVPICGTGTYNFKAVDNLWEIFVQLITDDGEINGSSQVLKELYIYTQNTSQEPEPLENNCAVYYDL